VNGIVDLHVHSAPSLLPRHGNDSDTARAARAAGVSTLVLKAHEGSTAERALLAGDGAVGGVVLNSTVGGANPDAVRVARLLGARVVWLPTISAQCHQSARQNRELDIHRDLHFRSVEVCADGRLDGAWNEVFEEIAAADMVLASGHVSMDEAVVAFKAARALGVRRFLVNHPLMPFLGWRDDHVTSFLELGAYIELGILVDLIAGVEPKPTQRLASAYPAQLLAFGSDLGHADHPTLGDGIDQWLPGLIRVVGEAAATRIMTTSGRELLSL
jgi:hypothetical protein